ncbi:hypothetical protein AAIL47_09775 [Limosilactobacillus fermentum]
MTKAILELNEELRGLIKSIESVTDEELTMISKYLNWRPRKCLGWKTPLQVFFGDLSEKIRLIVAIYRFK